VWGINPSSSPSNGEAFELGESLEVEVLFSEPVIVRGSPGLVLTVGRDARLATLFSYYLGRPSSRLAFRYAVGPSDRDTDGFSTPANPLRLFGGTIRAAADGMADADLTHGGFTDQSFGKVDGARVTVPAVRAVSAPGPVVPGVPEELVLRGQTFHLEVEFTRDVTVSGSPQLALDIGGRTRLASHDPPSSDPPGSWYPRSLFFSYTVQDADRDTDGIRIPANALRLNGGTIEAAVDGSIDARLDHGAVTPRPLLKVDGSRSDPRKPEIGVVVLTHFDPVVLERGEEVGAQLIFWPDVFVTGNPSLALTVGSRTRLATCSGASLLRCRYTVRAADRDADGVSIPADALRLDGARIVSAADGVTDAVLTHAAVEADGIPMVDGSLATAPRVEQVLFDDTLDYREDGDTYRLGQSVQLRVRFDRPIEVTGTPVLELTVGDRQRLATCSGSHNVLVCRYRVQAADLDTDGVSVPGNALRLNNGTIAKLSDGGVTPALLSHGPLTGGPGRKVDGSRGGTVTTGVRDISILQAANGHTFEFGEIVEVQVGFDKPVTVVGHPQMTLTVGGRTRVATCAASGFGLRCLYAVQVSDRDADGISIPADALRLNGATIKARPDGFADAVLSHPPMPDDSSARVDGGRSTSLAVSVHLGYPSSVDAYERGETIWVALRVGRDVRLNRGSRGVVVTGSPQIALRVGDRVRLATYSEEGGPRFVPFAFRSNPQHNVWFGYTVRAEDRDTDGVSIGANAIRLNGGTIKLAVDGVTEPPLTHAAVGPDFLRKVDGSRFNEPEVGEVSLTGFPRNGDTYRLGEAIRVTVSFTRPVAITGTPGLVLTVGGRTRVASLLPGPSRSLTLIFEYTVQPADTDPDGISVPANALRLNGGRITLTDGATDVDLSHAAVADDIARKVETSDGGGPTVPVGECEPDAETACLQDSRFEVRTRWWTSDGRSGAAQVVPEGTDDSGLFWFFDADNWEILIKVLDGCSTNGHFWVFGAATTDLGYRITVTDTETGLTRVYGQGPGLPAPAITDTRAFRACAR